ncbi:hypothetical protein CN071_11430 [Sinorhizobium meliloti]|nr:hypothetical protein CN071_11430 [Sinorhizobium meliloti]
MHPRLPHSCTCHRNPARPSPWAGKTVSAVSAPLDRLYFEAGWACEKVSRTIWRFAWQMMDLLGATKLSSRAAETDVGRML